MAVNYPCVLGSISESVETSFSPLRPYVYTYIILRLAGVSSFGPKHVDIIVYGSSHGTDRQAAVKEVEEGTPSIQQRRK
jgi:hypothetical protein